MNPVSTSFSTASVSSAQRFGFWADVVCSTFVELDCARATGAGFYGHLQDKALRDWRLTQVRSNEHKVMRDRSRISRSSSDDFLISLQLAGTGMLAQDNREAVLHPGDLALYDVTRPYSLQFDSDFEQLVMRIPRNAMTDRLYNPGRATAVRVPGRQGLGRMASMLLLEMAQQAEMLDAGSLAKAQACTLDLIAQAIGEQCGSRSEQLSESQVLTLRRVLDYVERNIDDPELSCEGVAQANGISERYLRKLFNCEDMSLSEWIWRRRLEHARNDLSNPALGNRSITSIAFRWGFKDSAHFSRAFRRTFGKSPRDMRG